MPIYEYVCPKCGTKTELLQSMNNPTVPTCGNCNEPMNKTISLPGKAIWKCSTGTL